jgi:hypothetical protein
VKIVEIEKRKAVYGKLYGEKSVDEEKFFLGIFVINPKSFVEFIAVCLFTFFQMGAYWYMTHLFGDLNLQQIAVWLFVGIFNLYLITRFISHYIVLPRISHKVQEKITANWADAIRYSRYPATMIVAVFTIFVFICWLIVASDLKNHITRFPVILMLGPLICAMIGYSACAYYTFRGTSPIFDEERKRNSSVRASAYWMVAEYFLIFSLVDIFVLTVYFFNFIIK